MDLGLPMTLAIVDLGLNFVTSTVFSGVDISVGFLFEFYDV